MSLKSIIKHFLDAHWDQKSPLLLGYSGGPDSKALLYLLHSWKVPLHVAHVDHGWRKESSLEAEELKSEIEALHLPFYLHKLKIASKNIEAEARLGRFAFFRSLFEKIPFGALLLGHQANDVAETCLKRIAEGAHLPHLFGMESVSEIEGLPIWRPLLFVEKTKLFEFLKQQKLTPLIDPTSFDLRSKMRKQVFPLLEKVLGKNHLENWTYLSARSAELKRYLEKKTASIPVQQTPKEIALFLAGVERIEARYLLLKHRPLPRALIEKILDAVEKKTKKICLAPNLIVENGVVFLKS